MAADLEEDAGRRVLYQASESQADHTWISASTGLVDFPARVTGFWGPGEPYIWGSLACLACLACLASLAWLCLLGLAWLAWLAWLGLLGLACLASRAWLLCFGLAVLMIAL